MFNLVESIQKNLGYAKLYKVDPNTQDIDEKEKSFGNNSLAQAGIPAVLCGLFNYILRPEGDSLTLLPENAKWLTPAPPWPGMTPPGVANGSLVAPALNRSSTFRPATSSAISRSESRSVAKPKSRR